MKITWQSPSNIALIKYWGKHGNQLPNNASLSLSLSECYTETSIALEKKKTKKLEIDFLFEGKKSEPFEKKILHFLESVSSEFNFLQTNKLIIHSHNSFPHSSGIASSASSMSALALCLCSLNAVILKNIPSDSDFFKHASKIARLGSGSASRSVYSGFSVWGKLQSEEKFYNTYAINYPKIYHSNFTDIQDTILIVSEKEKGVSSRAGHALMQNHPMEKIRYAHAAARLKEMLHALTIGDWDLFIAITEAEALELHALMMTSSPSFILMKPHTLEIIDRIRHFRAKSKLPVCFTLDAGPNVHVLYPYYEKKLVRNFIQTELAELCVHKKIIYDYMGKGPKQLFDE